MGLDVRLTLRTRLLLSMYKTKKKGEASSCPCCNNTDDVKHTLFFCPGWTEIVGTHSRSKAIKAMVRARLGLQIFARRVACPSACVEKAAEQPLVKRIATSFSN